ncbi:MAG: PQQ-binding-like beta-propeller repeat protein, partial [Planctomyces sp.]
YEAATGKVRWKKRVGGNYSASPLLAGQKLYMLNESGTTLVANIGGSYKLLSRNLLDGRTLSSLSAAGQSLLLRTDSHLLRIEATANDDEPANSVSDDEKPSQSTDSKVNPAPDDDSGIRIRGSSLKNKP